MDQVCGWELENGTHCHSKRGLVWREDHDGGSWLCFQHNVLFDREELVEGEIPPL